MTTWCSSASTLSLLLAALLFILVTVPLHVVLVQLEDLFNLNLFHLNFFHLNLFQIRFLYLRFFQFTFRGLSFILSSSLFTDCCLFIFLFSIFRLIWNFLSLLQLLSFFLFNCCRFCLFLLISCSFDLLLQDLFAFVFFQLFVFFFFHSFMLPLVHVVKLHWG